MQSVLHKTHKPLTIHKASAGSGKTYKLAFEYIRMLLGVKREQPLVRNENGKEVEKWYRLNLSKYGDIQINPHRHILAITFTNKATEEMKTRIIENLYDLANIPSAQYADADYAEALCNEYECTREELARVAMWTLRRMLYDYNYFNVSTIDSFFQKVLRSFARELNQQGDFSLELDDNSVMQIAVGNMLDDFNCGRSRSPGLFNWLVNFMEKRLEEGRKHNFFNRRSRAHTSLVNDISKIKNEDFKPFWDAMKKYLFGAPGNRLELFEAALKQQVEQAPQDLRAKGEAFYYTVTDVIDAFYKDLSESLKSLATGQPCDASKLGKIITKFSDGDYNVIKGNAGKKYKGFTLSDSQIKELTELINLAYYRYYTLNKLRDGVHTLKLLTYAWPYQEEYAGENNLVMLSSTNDLLSRIIGKDDAPFIYERVGVMLQNFLIDEFQDTSYLQWHNLQPLVLNGLSQQADSLIIGDEKQSIYRFRNSDSSLLHHKVAEEFPDMHKVEGTTVSQNTNYRSSSEVVKFNNTLFSILPYLGDKTVPGYENAIQTVKNSTKRGYVLFEPYDMNDDKEQETERMLEDMCQNILREHDAGIPWRQIAILVDKHVFGGEAINYMMAHHPIIPVMSGESLYIKKSSAVQLVIGVLRIIDKIQSADNPTTTPSKPYPSLAEVTLMLSRYEYFFSKGYTASDSLTFAINPNLAMQQNAPDDVVSGINSVIDRNPSSLLSLVDTIIALHLSDELRTSQIAYLLALQDLVADYSERYTPSVHSFLQWWDKNDNIAIQGADDTDAVRVMTVHKSKGLEFGCVHIPFASWGVGRSREMWIKTPTLEGIDERLLPPALLINLSEFSKDWHFKELADIEAGNLLSDTMNKIYVAYTRAVSELIVYYSPIQNARSRHIGPMLVDAFSKCDHSNIGQFQTDLSQHYDATTCRFEYGKPYDQMDQEERSGKSEDKKPKRPTQGKERKPIEINYDITMRADADVLTTLNSALSEVDEDINQEDTQPRYTSEDFPDEAARIFGTQLHDIMSGIIVRDDLNRACDRVALRSHLSVDDAQKQRRIIESAINQDDDRVAKWFSGEGRVLNERSIYNPSIDENRRLDRMVIYTDGTADIIDYKFTSKTRDAHRNQLEKYVTLVRDMGEYTEVRGYLWYPLKKEIIQI